MSSRVNLPQEIVADILSRLPAKSLGKFRCVSKLWLSLLTDPQFIKTHLIKTRHSLHQDNLVVLISQIDHTLHTLNLENPNNFNHDHSVVSRKLTFPQLPNHNFVSFLGSCNGLVLVTSEDGSKFLINPTTLELKGIPDSPVALKPNESFSMHGFGYDHFSDDYKVVTLSYYDTDNEHEPDIDYTFVDMYSVKTGVWKRVENSPYDHAVPVADSGAFLNDCIHWLASSKAPGYPSVIAAFNLSDEKFFREVPAPSSLDEDKFVFDKLMVLGGCLCLVHDNGNGLVDVWMMREYGVEESWTKFIVSGVDYYDFLKPVCFLVDDEIVLEVDGEKVIVYNTKEESSRDIVVDGLQSVFGKAITYMESLVSPNFSRGPGPA